MAVFSQNSAILFSIFVFLPCLPSQLTTTVYFKENHSMSSKTLSVNTSQIQRICNDRVIIKAGHLQQQLKDKHQQYAGRVTIVDHHGTNDQQ